MLIGSWDIKEAGAKQWRVTFGNHGIANNAEWIKGSPVPVYTNNTIGFKPLKTVLMVKGNSREEILRKRSSILSRCLTPQELTLDAFSHKFYGILKKYSAEETAVDRWHLLELEWEGTEYGEMIVEKKTGQKDITLQNPGNMVTPAIVQIVPQMGAADLVIQGLCRDAVSGKTYDTVIKNITVGKEIVLDGETGRMTEEGVLKTEDIEIWELPTLLPGENTIRLDQGGMDVTVKFRPRYM